MLVTADGSLRRGKPIPMKAEVDGILGELPKLEHVVVVERTRDRVPDAGGPRRLVARGAGEGRRRLRPPSTLDAEHPLYILYTSGSTAKPKGILHTTGGYLTGVYATTKLIFDVKPDSDVYWCAADIGWVTGHSYIVYGPLANGAHLGDVRGRARLPGQGPLVGDRRGVQGRRSCTRRRPRSAPASSGDASTRRSTTCRRCGCSGRSASRSTRRRGSGTTR